MGLLNTYADQSRPKLSHLALITPSGETERGRCVSADMIHTPTTRHDNVAPRRGEQVYS